MEKIKRFLKEEEGMETVEWAVMAGLIAAATVTIIVTLSGQITTAFTNLSAAVTGS
jgi:Flp pilus assembly pilin Flp